MEERFVLMNQVEESFQRVKQKLIEALVVALPNVEKVFKVDHDAFKVDIGVFLF